MRRYFIKFTFITLFLINLIAPAYAGKSPYPLKDGEALIGKTRKYKVRKNESLFEVARKFNVGFNEITDANPGVDPYVPGKGRMVVIPSSWLLPDIRPDFTGLVVNLPERRLYHIYEKNKKRYVATFPIGIGSEGTETPPGIYRITEKKENPDWNVPMSIRRERPHLPPVVKAGPDNPLGSHAMRLSGGDIMIHGTNRPWGIGREVSHGCIRLYPEDIPRLFETVGVGTAVIIADQPLKAAMVRGRVYIEVDGRINSDLEYETGNYLREKDLLDAVDPAKLDAALKDRRGVPVDISADNLMLISDR